MGRPRPQNAPPLAEHHHFGDPIDGHQFGDDFVLDPAGQAVDTAGFPPHRNLHDGGGVVLRLDHDQPLDPFGQAALNPADGLADVVGGHVQVAIRSKLRPQPEIPSSDDERTETTPSTRATAPSTTDVTSASMVVGEAPG